MESISRIKEVIMFNFKDKPKTFSPPLSDLGRFIANSYLPANNKAIIEDIDINKAKIPKSLGVYILLKIGNETIEIICAIAVPEINVNTFLVNSDFVIFLINFTVKIICNK